MTDDHRKITFSVNLTQPPRIKVDRGAGAAYVRFREGKVAKTVVLDQKDVLVTLDLDADGGILGMELVGVEAFDIETIAKAGVPIGPPELFQDAVFEPLAA